MKQYPHNQLCFLTSVFHFLNRKPTQFPWQRRILVLYSHLSVMSTLGSIWSLFSRHLRNNLGIAASWQYKQIRLSINKPQWGWGEGCFAPTEGLPQDYFLFIFGPALGIRRSPSFLSPFVQACARGGGALTQSISEKIGWLFFPLSCQSPL